MKKAISPIVATSLLLIVAVLSITGFQNWYSGYQSSTLAGVEEQSQTSSSLNVEGIVGDTLYLKSGSETVLNILKISDSNGNDVCEVNNIIQGGISNVTRLLLNFDDGTATDFSRFSNDGAFGGGMSCSILGINQKWL